MNDLKAKIREQITKLIEHYREIGHTLDQGLSKGAITPFSSELAEINLQLGRLNATLRIELIQVTTRYVITADTLISPAGFHPDEHIFKRPAHALYVDIIPTLYRRRDYQGMMKCYDMRTKVNIPIPHHLT